MNSLSEISRSFDAHAMEYEQVAAVQIEIGQRLVDRLDYLKITPRYILDIGCGPGTLLAPIQQRFPEAQIIAIDISHAMLCVADAKKAMTRHWGLVNTDMHHLPFAAGQFDLVFSNQVLHWSPAMQMVLRELNRVLHPGGCLLFSTLGPDTFQELRQAFQTADHHAHVNEFQDMHHIGDYLLSELFDDPVVDMEILTAHYASLPDLLRRLKAQGVKNIHPKRNAGLTGKNSWRTFKQSMSGFMTETQKYPLTYEVVYGHAWKSQRHRAEQGVETSISVTELMASLEKRT